MDQHQLRMIITTSAQIGAKIALTEVGLCKSELTKAEAYRKYSRRTIDKWVKSGQLVPVLRGRKALFKSVDIEILSKTNQLYADHLSEQVN